MASLPGQNTTVLDMLAWSRGIVPDLHASVEKLFFEWREEIYVYRIAFCLRERHRLSHPAWDRSAIRGLAKDSKCVKDFTSM